MAKFSDALASHFSSRIRSRGLDYFRSDSVRIESAGEKSIVATVEGGAVYVVTLSIEKQPRAWRVSGDCTCPYAQDEYSPCKHLWALILACDSLPSLRSPPASVSFMLSDWDEDIEGDEDDFLDDPIPYPIKTPAAK
ncbi:MAG: SWIM zinc finger family protein [Planctomycetes bacterium]|nr:SWIM zinc finger family protein [Planctomycetota bacterium]